MFDFSALVRQAFSLQMEFRDREPRAVALGWYNPGLQPGNGLSGPPKPKRGRRFALPPHSKGWFSWVVCHGSF